MTGQFDVVVYAATSAGVCAAVAAAQAGASTLLVEPGRHVGGMTSGGLGYTDVGDVRVLGGMAARLRNDIAEHYGVAPGHFAGPEPHVAEAILIRWLEEAGVEVSFGHPVSAVETKGNRIASATFGDLAVSAGAFVDASYEGDLLALAGVPFAVGREDRALHGERFAGRRELMPGRHAMPPWISPFGERGELLPQIKPEPMVDVGAGDGGVMSFGYRLCLTTAGDRVPFERRDGYDEAHWELGRRYFAATETLPAGRYLGLEQNLPGAKADGNSLGPFSLSVHDGAAWEYPTASVERREELRLHHLHHAQDFLWWLSNDPGVPRSVREELSRWGLPRDEFADTGHMPHQLYVREARRMMGEHVLTEHDLVAGRRHPDTVAMGSYHLDIREVQRTWAVAYEHSDPVPMVVTEGYLSVGVPPYEIPYRSLLPRREHCENLLAAVCISASHVAFSSVRMEPQYQMLGHAAGLAAAMAVEADAPAHDIDVPNLQERLAAAGQVLRLGAH